MGRNKKIAEAIIELIVDFTTRGGAMIIFSLLHQVSRKRFQSCGEILFNLLNGVNAENRSGKTFSERSKTFDQVPFPIMFYFKYKITTESILLHQCRLVGCWKILDAFHAALFLYTILIHRWLLSF